MSKSLPVDFGDELIKDTSIGIVDRFISACMWAWNAHVSVLVTVIHHNQVIPGSVGVTLGSINGVTELEGVGVRTCHKYGSWKNNIQRKSEYLYTKT